jgi:hypothetical protein
MSNPTQDDQDPDSVAHSNDWIYIQHEDKEPSVIRYDLFVKQLFPGTTKNEMIYTALGSLTFLSRQYNTTYSEAEMLQLLGQIRYYTRALQNIYGLSDQKVLQANANYLSDVYKKLTKE